MVGCWLLYDACTKVFCMTLKEGEIKGVNIFFLQKIQGISYGHILCNGIERTMWFFP